MKFPFRFENLEKVSIPDIQIPGLINLEGLYIKIFRNVIFTADFGNIKANERFDRVDISYDAGNQPVLNCIRENPPLDLLLDANGNSLDR